MRRHVGSVSRWAAMVGLVGGALVWGAAPAGAAISPSFFVWTSDATTAAHGAERVISETSGGTLAVTGDATDVTVTADEDALHQRLELTAPTGQTLQPGDYSSAGCVADPTGPTLSRDPFGSTCSQLPGWFRILDIGTDVDGNVNRLDALYEYHWQESPTPTVEFGEVSVGQSYDGAVLLAPRVLHWPAQHPGTHSVHPVRVLVPGSSAVTFGTSSISGADAGAFAIRDDGCAGRTLDPGGGCLIYVDFKPSAAGSLGAELVIPDDTAAASHSTTLEGTGRPGNTSWDLEGPKTSAVLDVYEGHRNNLRITPATSVQTAFLSSDNRLHLVASVGRDKWEVAIQVPAGGLQTGTTYPAVNTVTSTQNFEVLAPQFPSCTPTGALTVHEAEFDAVTHQPTALSFTFYRNCDGGRVRGSIAYQASDVAQPVPAPPFIALKPVSDLAVGSASDALTLRWSNPPSTEFDHVVVRMATGAVPPKTRSSGVGIYSGKGTGVTLDQLVPTRDYAFSVFAVNTHGAASSRASVVAFGVDLALSASKAAVSTGEPVAISVYLHRADGHAIAKAKVYLYARKVGTHRWGFVKAFTTSSTGHGKSRFTIGASLDFCVRYFGAGQNIGTSAGPVTVRLR